MAQTEITEILNNLRDDLKLQSESLEKILTLTNSKLELISEDKEVEDLMRIYISELKKVVEDKFNSEIIKIEELAVLTDSIPAKISFEPLEKKIANFRPVLDDLKDVISDSLTQNKDIVIEHFSNLESRFSSIITNSDFTEFRKDLGEFIQKVVDNSTILNTEFTYTGEKLENIISSIKSINFKEDFENIVSKLYEIKDSIENNDSYITLSSEIAELSDNINTSFSNFGETNEQNYSELKNDLSDIKNNLTTLSEISYTDELNRLSNLAELTADDISILKEEFRQSAESDLENSSRLSDKTYEISDKLNQVEETLASVKEIIEKSDNKEQLINEFQKFKEELPSVVTSEDFANFRTDFTDFIRKIIDNANVLHLNSDAVKEQISIILDKFAALNYKQDFENIAGSVSEIKSSFENNSKMNYENITNSINDLKAVLSQNVNNQIIETRENSEKIVNVLSEAVSDIKNIRDLSANKHLEILDSISQELHTVLNSSNEKINTNIDLNFGGLKTTIEKINTEFENLKTDIIKTNDSSMFLLSSGFENVKASIETLSNIFSSVSDSIENISEKHSERILSNILELISNIDELKAEIHQFSSNYLDKISGSIGELSTKIDSISDFSDFYEKLEDLKNIISNLNFDENILEQINNLKILITENSTDERLISKLCDLESAIIHNSDNAEHNLEILQTKIAEFAHIVENSNSDTEGKIAASLEEITSIKDELSGLSEVLKSSKLSTDEKLSETLSIIDSGIENIIFNLNTINENVNRNEGIKETVESIDEKFDSLSGLINELKNEHSLNNVDLITDIEEKVTALKDELTLINTDIAAAIQCKSEEIIRAFEPVKTGIDEFIGFDFEKIISDLKSQIELSFMNFSVDVNSEFASASENISHLEQAFKEIYSKLSVVEDCVSEKIQNNIELLNAAFESNIRGLKSDIKEQIEVNNDELKQYLTIAINNSQLENAVKTLKDSLLNKLTEVCDIQQESASNYEIISSKVSTLSNNLKDYISTAVREITENCSTNRILPVIDLLHQNNDEIKTTLENINSKIDIIALDNTTEELQIRFDELDENHNKVEEMLSTLNIKVDTLAADDSQLNILEEIDDIKNIIFEQRKFFEESSDEKTAAIDKYLRDVLLKLDSVDLEKNSEDIKESILNALVSLVDQISFVEETEDIKDFVEEKTGEIKENIIEIQKQLKQLANPDDDFEYVYTLQDVETDIAKLRLAINNMNGNDLSDVTDEIKNLTGIVEGLESSLTQEQIIDLKNDFEKLNEDIVSISSRTNKLLLNSDESYKALNDGLSNFNNVIFKLEDRLNYLDTTAATERLERKLDDIQTLSIASANSDKIFKEVMTCLGEWIDATDENINRISEKTAEIDNVKESIQELKSIIPEKTGLLNELEQKFEKQEKHIENLEMKIEKILSKLDEKDDMLLNRKVDKIEKMLSQFGANIEKLTSYVE